MDPNDLRIGDAEREQTMADLREHFAQGRLTHEELDQRLDQALAARTARDLAQVTGDLPMQGRGYPAAGYHEAYPQQGPPQGFDMDAFRESMRAQRQQMQSMRHAHRQARRAWAHAGHPWRHRRGPGPFLPILFVFLILGLIFGGFGIFKVLFGVWIVAMIFGFIHRHSHHRRT
ncbi:DUF1707 domain-containing protein [Nonomuraea sp. NPDC000554]|uniref:DUF1707 SHOCT-like domain-containing protein n=1 Tax=Nonomuraea sp. NPDC000554 TaxID=3154259 RepID=UPI00332B1002